MRMWNKGYTCALLVECKLVQPLWRTVQKFHKNFKIELPYNLAIPLLGWELAVLFLQPLMSLKVSQNGKKKN